MRRSSTGTSLRQKPRRAQELAALMGADFGERRNARSLCLADIDATERIWCENAHDAFSHRKVHFRSVVTPAGVRRGPMAPYGWEGYFSRAERGALAAQSLAERCATPATLRFQAREHSKRIGSLDEKGNGRGGMTCQYVWLTPFR